jgi:hypothetical protein
VVALIRSAHPGMPPGAVAALLQNSAQPMSCPTDAERAAFLTPAGFDLRCTGGGQTSFYGDGLVDALAASKK